MTWHDAVAAGAIGIMLQYSLNLKDFQVARKITVHPHESLAIAERAERIILAAAQGGTFTQAVDFGHRFTSVVSIFGFSQS